MLLDAQRYPVLMSRTMHRWLVYRVLQPALEAGPQSWSHAGRITYSRLETLYARAKQVSFLGDGGRVLSLAPRDARTLLGVIECADSIATEPPPRSARALADRLRWQVGDVDHLEGVLPERARTMRLIPVGPGEYLTQGGGLLAAPGGSKS